MITVENLTKDYGKTRAVDHLSFALRPGTVTGFLGPNGSGKSTTMRCIVGLDRPTSGRTAIKGQAYEKLASPLTTVGALLDGKAFHPKRTAKQQLEIVAASHGIGKARVNEVMELTGIAKVAKQKLGGFSLGMGQRLGIALALLGDPEVLIFDEPVNGLDPDGVRWVRKLMRDLAAEGRTVLVSSHLMSEMALTADDLVIIGRGRLIASGAISDFTESAGKSRIRVAGPKVSDMQTILRERGLSPEFHQPEERYPQGFIELTGMRRQEVGKLLYEEKFEIHELSESYSSLEDVFMELTSDQLDYTSGQTSSSPQQRGGGYHQQHGGGNPQQGVPQGGYPQQRGYPQANTGQAGFPPQGNYLQGSNQQNHYPPSPDQGGRPQHNDGHAQEGQN